jgi:hypothetical protein
MRPIKKQKAIFRNIVVLIVTDGEREECVDPGENGAILDAVGGGGPNPPGGGKNGQLASDGGGV